MELGKTVQLITNASSGILKHVLKLRDDKSYRNKTGRCVIQTDRRLLDELTSSRENPSSQHTIPKKIIFYSPGDQDYIHTILRNFPKTHKFFCVTNESLLHKITGLENEDPYKCFIAEFSKPPDRPVLLRNEIEELMEEGTKNEGENYRPNFRRTAPPSFVVFNHLQDPGNVGNILRCCVGFNYRHAFFVKGTTDCWNDKVLRASRGALLLRNAEREAVLTYEIGTIDRLLQISNEYKMPIMVSETSKGESLDDVQQVVQKEKKIIVFNNEAAGLSDEEREIFRSGNSKFVSIPMSASCTSLNVASAAAVMLYSFRDKM